MDDHDLYAALLHETKNHLVLLTLTLDSIPHTRQDAHDAPLDAARLLGHKVAERLMQAMLLYKAEAGALRLNAVNAYSPEDMVAEMAQQARSLAKHLEVVARVDADVPPIWFFDRNLLQMALMNAIHNSISYARARIEVRAALSDGMLALSVRDDSDGYPEHILELTAQGLPLQSNGTGLGIRFARLIAQAHRNEEREGELRLYNDAGAVFEMRLP
ncbi:sensor histidine kinase [Parasulfuritortus cantonensis]|uniref:histidine kinase n=1 Tax=Parasulfuritortus cantonensis TaxID=2528202 RepID=A0A4R1B2Q7_9PROT|nr:ATP-binding protein [Parasulfuritortus cantonensis]TCJ12334.1 sensor histidine kinase [Parasulfuritortus cantonensis]